MQSHIWLFFFVLGERPLFIKSTEEEKRVLCERHVGKTTNVHLIKMNRNSAYVFCVKAKKKAMTFLWVSYSFSVRVVSELKGEVKPIAIMDIAQLFEVGINNNEFSRKNNICPIKYQFHYILDHQENFEK